MSALEPERVYMLFGQGQGFCARRLELDIMVKQVSGFSGW